MSVAVTDYRSNTREKPIWQAVFSQMTWINTVHTPVTSSTATINGEIKSIIVTPTEATSGSTTFSVDLYDADDNKLSAVVATLDDAAGVTVYSQSDFGTAVLVDGFYIIADINQDPGTNGTTLDITVRGT